MPILDYFPVSEATPSPRDGQKFVLSQVEEALSAKKRFIILEAPVGAGKSAIALTIAQYAGASFGETKPGESDPIKCHDAAHVLTPRKSLQDQYFDDFEEFVVTMKGRAAYPCTREDTSSGYSKVVNLIRKGRVPPPFRGDITCATAPCRDSAAVKNLCTQDRACPYQVAIETAQGSPIIVHNLHSFIFQTNFSGKFERRKTLIVDEAHEIEGILRDFLIKKITVKRVVKEGELTGLNGIDHWSGFLLSEEFVPIETAAEAAKKAVDETFQSERDKYLVAVDSLNSDLFKKGFSVERVVKESIIRGAPSTTTFEFVPHSIAAAAQSLLFDYGDVVVLMSGTIYNKDVFCKALGIPPEGAAFIRISSTFPVQNRPIYAKPKFLVDTSHAKWQENFPQIVENCRTIMGIFGDAKGLIHAPSYALMDSLANAIGGDRLVAHTNQDFQSRLADFYEKPGNQVFISPICQQGVDFKGDRARFQIVIRVPNPNTSSAFMTDMVQNNFPWYNLQALITFGQMVGRVNRGPDDYGATFLLDERFIRFVNRNRGALPKWLLDAIVWK